VIQSFIKQYPLLQIANNRVDLTKITYIRCHSLLLLPLIEIFPLPLFNILKYCNGWCFISRYLRNYRGCKGLGTWRTRCFHNRIWCNKIICLSKLLSNRCLFGYECILFKPFLLIFGEHLLNFIRHENAEVLKQFVIPSLLALFIIVLRLIIISVFALIGLSIFISISHTPWLNSDHRLTATLEFGGVRIGEKLHVLILVYHL